MANQKHVDILKQGVDVWNEWREDHPKIKPNLRSCHLGELNLRGINFSETNLKQCNLWETNLSGANLSNADLSYGYMRGANLRECSLVEAKLIGCNLGEVSLNSARLDGADFSYALAGDTIFGNVDLSKVKGLETVRYLIPSTLDIRTIIRSQGYITESFLRGVGVPESIIENIPALISAMKPIDFYSCFISYSSNDQLFAERLYNDLQGKGVRCWYAPKDLKAGDKFWHRIDESIRLYDKLLVILSKNSVESPWVENEVMAAIEKEHQNPDRTVLFPIRIDEAIMETNIPWAASFRRSRHILDFTKWKRPEQYQKALEKLLKDLNK
jgi:uncharacterized protein YjbI with pentapeptide repeats